MKIEMHRLSGRDGWELVKTGDFVEMIWDDWERDWVCELLDSDSDYLRIGDTLFNVVHEARG